MTFVPPTSRQRTHCVHGGHELTADNVYTDPDGNRHCRACRKLAQKRDKQVLVELACPVCKGAHSKTRKAVRRSRVLAVFPVDWCRGCVNAELGRRAAAKRKREKDGRWEQKQPELKPVVVLDDWRTPEERERYDEYWTRRFSWEEIHELARSLHHILDVGGSPARKSRRMRRAA